jgi:hypothetical protein
MAVLHAVSGLPVAPKQPLLSSDPPNNLFSAHSASRKLHRAARLRRAAPIHDSTISTPLWSSCVPMMGHASGARQPGTGQAPDCFMRLFHVCRVQAEHLGELGHRAPAGLKARMSASRLRAACQLGEGFVEQGVGVLVVHTRTRSSIGRAVEAQASMAWTAAGRASGAGLPWSAAGAGGTLEDRVVQRGSGAYGLDRRAVEVVPRMPGHHAVEVCGSIGHAAPSRPSAPQA